ncbi:MAG TPA: nucleotidyltransferase family protein [Mucilaginibacter sp.]
MNYGIVILAAGNSSRLGRPKQLLKFQGKTLLSHTVHEAVKATGRQTIVVTGANKDLVENELLQLPVHFIHNFYWQDGISSSLYIGIISLLKIFPHLDGIIISVCDQPYISAELFKRMIAGQQQTKKGIVATAYKNAIGVPVLFSARYFAELLDLDGQDGAKILLNNHPDDLTTIIFVNGEIDIDTPADERKLIP